MKSLSDVAVVSKETRLFVIQKQDRLAPAEILYRPLSYREVQSLFEMYGDSRQNTRVVKAFEMGVVGSHHIEGVPANQELGSFLGRVLPYDVVREVGTEILKLSVPSAKVFTRLIRALDIGFDKALQADTWKCSVCQEKKLDKARNCPLLGNEKKDKTFRMYLKEHPYTYCIMAERDGELLHKAMECHRMFDVGILPDAGGFHDQTHFFIDATSIVRNRVQQAEIEAMNEVSKKKR